MSDWHARWNPAPGDRAQLVRGRTSGTIVEVQGQRVKLEYDLSATSAPMKKSDMPTGEETGWHDREELEPIEDTARRVAEGR